MKNLTLFSISVLFSTLVWAAPSSFVYEGIIYDNTGVVITNASQQFKADISVGGSACYSQTLTPVNVLNGNFALTIDGTGTYSVACTGLTDLQKVFSLGSAKTLTIQTWNGTSWESFSSIAINSVPYAVDSSSVGGFSSANLLRVDNAGTPGAASALTSANFTELLALITGTTTQYVKPGSAVFTGAPQYSGAVSGVNDLTNKSYVDAAVLAGLPNTGTPGTYYKVTTDAKGRVTSGQASLVATDIPSLDAAKITTGTFLEAQIPTLTTAGKVSGAAITSGAISGTTSINSSGNIVTSGTVSANLVSGNAVRVYNGAINYVGLTAPAMGAPVSFVLPGTDGTVGQVLKTDGAGNFGWTNQSSGTVTSVTSGGAPIVVGGTASAPTVSINLANASTNGYLSTTDWNTFNNKLSTSLTNGNIWVGNAGSTASPIVPGGDVSMTNAGAFTVNKLKNTGIDFTVAPSNGNYFKYNGTNWIPSGLDASDIGSGTLPIARGGTGLTAYGNNSVIVSNGTGTALASLNCASGQIIKYDASGFAGCGADNSGAAPGDASYTAKGIVQFSVDAATSGITIASGLANVNMGTGANQIVQLDASSKLPIVDGSALINLNAGNITSGVLPITRGGTNSGTALNNNRMVVSSGGALVETAALTNGQILLGSTAAAPVVATLGASNGIVLTPGAGSLSVATNATSANTVSTIVSRDATGNLAAGAITNTSNILKGATSGQLTMTVPPTVTPYTLTWPGAVGATGAVLTTTDGGGTLTWGSPAAIADASYTVKGAVQFSSNATTSGITIASGVANVNMGIGPNQIVQLDGTSKLPIVDGSALTSLSSANLSTITQPGKIAIAGVTTGTGLSVAGTTTGTGINVTGTTSGNGINSSTTTGKAIVAAATTAGGIGLQASALTSSDAINVSSGNITVGGTGVVYSSQFSASAGSQGGPSFNNMSDTLSGMFFPANSIIGFSTAGSEKMRIDNAGNVGIGITSPGAQLQINTKVVGTIGQIIKWGAAGQTGDLLEFQSNTGAVLSRIDNNGKFYGDGSNLTGVVAAAVPLHFLTAATGTSTIANANNAITWNWDTLSTQNAMSMGTTSMTSGSLLTLSDTFNSATSIGKVLNLNVTGASNAAIPIGINNSGTGVSIDINASGAGPKNMIRMLNSVAATNNSGGQITYSANRTGAIPTDVAGVSGIITDITNGAYKGALVFSTANNAAPVERMRIDNNGNVGIGTASPTATLDVYGDINIKGMSAIKSSYVVGSKYVVVGPTNAANGISGTQNTIMGPDAGFSMGSATNNTLIGFESGYSLNATTTSDGNTFIGSESGRSMQGSNNVAVGFFAGGYATAGNGSNNNFIGRNSGYAITSGSNNVIIGDMAGSTVTSGNNNIFLGKNAGSAVIGGSNNVIIGMSPGGAGMTNTVIISDGSGNERIHVEGTNGNVGIGTTAPAAKLEVAGQIVSKEFVVSSGPNIDFTNGNSQVFQTTGVGSINLAGLQPGGSYTILVTDTSIMTHTFAGCTTKFKPTNANTIGGHTIYSIQYMNNTCYISWSSGW